MARFKLTDAGAGLINAFTGVVTAVAKSAEEVPNVVHTFSKKYELSSKVELVEDIQESSIPGADLNTKVVVVKNTISMLGWQI